METGNDVRSLSSHREEGSSDACSRNVACMFLDRASEPYKQSKRVLKLSEQPFSVHLHYVLFLNYFLTYSFAEIEFSVVLEPLSLKIIH